MRETFRASMGFLHTWSGILASALLFAIFWMGTLSVFDKEIDQWMIPETRLPAPPQNISYDQFVPKVVDLAGGSTTYLYFRRPDARNPSLKSYYFDTKTEEYERATFNPVTGEQIETTDSLAGTGFIFPFHFSLHLRWNNVGYWLVGFAGMSMLVLIVSGIFIHRKIVQDFFTFRSTKKARRLTLDLHNMTSLTALPFHFLFALTGLLIFASIYLPLGVKSVAGDDEQGLYQEIYGSKQLTPANEPGELVSLDAMVAEATRLWTENGGYVGPPDNVRVSNVGDKNATVFVRNSFPSGRVAMNQNVTSFNGSTGEVIHNHVPSGTMATFSWLEGFHFVQFGHWPLRWLYFVAGLAGCAMMSTGLIFWVQARIKKGAVDPLKVRSIRALTIGSTTGIIIATGAFFIANRVLPFEAEVAGFDRAQLEMWAFFVVWVGTFVHASLRGAVAWMDQSFAIAGASIASVLLNWATTGDHLVATAVAGQWAVFGMDMTLLAAAAIGVVSGVKARSVTAAKTLSEKSLKPKAAQPTGALPAE
ncbi:MAG: PepSY-associated TM helix domain-containing protein [Pseudomonadota bacterium]